jgi:hypothetical protein
MASALSYVCGSHASIYNGEMTFFAALLFFLSKIFNRAEYDAI